MCRVNHSYIFLNCITFFLTVTDFKSLDITYILIPNIFWRGNKLNTHVYPSGVVGHINIRKRVNVLKMNMLFNSALDSRKFAKENERFSLKYSFFLLALFF